MSEQKTILVTGGSGFIGSVTCTLLQQSGYNVINVDRVKRSLEGVTQYPFDIANNQLKGVLELTKPDAVIHLAANHSVPKSVGNPAETYFNNVANKLAIKSLENAKKYLNEKELFYESLETCITGFLTTKFNFKNTDLVTESIKQKLTKIGVDKKTIQDLLKTLNTCQYFKFTPNSEFDTNNDYEKSVELIMKLQNFKL